MPRRRNFKQRIHKMRRGAATVEMAMVAPFIILLVFGSIEFARMMMVRQAMTNAAREGCRHACLATTGNANDSISIVKDTLTGVVRESAVNDVVRASMSPAFTTPPAAGTQMIMAVEVDCADVSWLPPVFYSGAKISVVASMARE